jgi:hypothetical protein
MAIFFVKPFGAFPHDGMGIGEGVNFAVKQNSFLNAFGKCRIAASFNAVCNKISDYDIFIITGKINMGQKIHTANLQNRVEVLAFGIVYLLFSLCPLSLKLQRIKVFEFVSFFNF